MWIYYQEPGDLLDPEGIHHPAYSGSGEHKNVAASQSLKNLGPLPCGVYRIGDPYDSEDHGPFVLPLTPDIANEMFGRGGFLIHGDSIAHPGTASKGCIITRLATRQKIKLRGDRELHVEARPPRVAIDPGIMNE